MIVWINGTHGAGKTTTSALVRQLLPDSRVFDAEKVSETLMTVLVEEYWREISAGLDQHAIPVRHFVLHADQDTLRARIAGDTVVGPDSWFRLKYLEPYAEASRAWLHDAAEVVDTTHRTPAEAAELIAESVKR
ncbi:ATP-binding protein [Streptomyces sp. NPDC047072]|uniref:ATP-binding protein n=1 Tax=Streptomyces sp. NPDC047072 TaxID=3154809 RepID=UPI0033CB68C4